MELPVYSDVKIADDFGIVDFVSTGPRGQIRKRIQIRPSHRPEIFTLALGDLKPGSDEIDDTSISDNGDRSKILTTVAFAIDIYTTRYPERWIYFRGNTKAKTRMYRMVIGRNLIVLSSRYHIYAEINDKLILFTKNMNVDGFLIKKKTITLWV